MVLLGKRLTEKILLTAKNPIFSYTKNQKIALMAKRRKKPAAKGGKSALLFRNTRRRRRRRPRPRCRNRRRNNLAEVMQRRRSVPTVRRRKRRGVRMPAGGRKRKGFRRSTNRSNFQRRSHLPLPSSLRDIYATRLQ